LTIYRNTDTFLFQNHANLKAAKFLRVLNEILSFYYIYLNKGLWLTYDGSGIQIIGGFL